MESGRGPITKLVMVKLLWGLKLASSYRSWEHPVQGQRSSWDAAATVPRGKHHKSVNRTSNRERGTEMMMW